LTLLGKHSLIERAASALESLVAWPELPPPTRMPAFIGHRGAARIAPENTLLSCRKALELGAEGVEVDVCVTRDGHGVLWHDSDPDDAVSIARQGGADTGAFVPVVPDVGDAKRRPIAELELADFLASHGYRPNDGTGAIVPASTLVNLFEWFFADPRARALMLDVKLGLEDMDRADSLLNEIERLGQRHAWGGRKLHLLVPEREVYERLASLLPKDGPLAAWNLTADFELPGAVEVAGELGARHVSIGITPKRPWKIVRLEMLEAVEAREAGKLDSVTAWTANDEHTLLDLAALQVDAVLTDDVPLALRVIERLPEASFSAVPSPA
jgi:glycerophosphoryl diester phosphodiesterase